MMMIPGLLMDTPSVKTDQQCVPLRQYTHLYYMHSGQRKNYKYNITAHVCGLVCG